ncbi:MULTISPECIES: glycoside hydrolase family 28 protein [Prauserella salsuginis group]|uniref:Glycoside hydrolase family 28 protein n=1 Tax=Prauserella salsuginis TaxID=387889 RepID=A0ABW6G1N8_9PSEU|nr:MULTISPECIES: glycoside hydrolase family 28 protein [Prauserella salsuginis group]MCR3722265.1 Glycosyl hydrolases family 28 [Prauserella flava]MCR3736263.1 Glycosyl hydrolases family 28 [Prauserella salsuginis]
MKQRSRPAKALLVALAGLLCAGAGSIAGAAPEPGGQGQGGKDPLWNMADRIVDTVEQPSIPDREFRVTEYGAVGDGKTDDHDAIMSAVRAAHESGGGRVILPEGTWLSDGPIHLESKIDLHVSDGARLLFGADPADYLPVVHTRWEGTEMYGYSPLIYAKDVHDVSITGTGVIDGNEASEFLSWYDKQDEDVQKLRRMGFDGEPLEQRRFGEGHFLRPSMIQFFGAERVLLSDYTVNNSPFWINHLVYTDHATVRNLTVDSHNANNDGVDVDSSTNVLVEKNRFRTGDDAVVVKSGRDKDGRDIGRPSERVVVRNNDMGGEDGIALGSEMSGDIRYVFFDDNTLRSGASAIRFKGNLDRGGTVEHIRVRDFEVEDFETLIWFQLDYPGELGGDFPPVYRDLVFEDFTVDSAATTLEVHGPEDAPLQDVTLRNITVADSDTPMVLENVRELTFDDLVIAGERIEGNLDWH